MSNQAWRASPVLGVANVRQAAEYYRDVLGFTLDPDGVFEPSGDEPGGVYAIVKRAGVWIHLQIRRGEIPQRVRQSHEGDVYLYVDDVTSLHAELQQRGAKILQTPLIAPYGFREIIIEDLNGYRLTFGEFAS
jgi:catechol 2,3-dioxygenase-like lactoylglutathione lyase family enzyme